MMSSYDSSRAVAPAAVPPWVLAVLLCAVSALSPSPASAQDPSATEGQPQGATAKPKKKRGRRPAKKKRAQEPSSVPPSAVSPMDAGAPSGEEPTRAAPEPSSDSLNQAAPPTDPPVPPPAASESAPVTPASVPATGDCDCDCEDDDEAAKSAASATVGAEVDLNSRFLWRGLAESRGAVLQPSAWAGLYGFTATVWSSVMLVYEPPHSRFSLSAVEPSLEYTGILWDRLKVEPQVSYYYWSSDEAPRSTVEAALKLSYRLGAFSVVSGNNFDLKTSPGAYWGVVGGEYERRFRHLTFSTSLDVAWATSDYNKSYLAMNVAAVDLVEAAVSLRYDLSDTLYLSLHSEASTLVALSLQRSVQEPTLVNGGVSFGVDY